MQLEFTTSFLLESLELPQSHSFTYPEYTLTMAPFNVVVFGGDHCGPEVSSPGSVCWMIDTDTVYRWPLRPLRWLLLFWDLRRGRELIGIVGYLGPPCRREEPRRPQLQPSRSLAGWCEWNNWIHYKREHDGKLSYWQVIVYRHQLMQQETPWPMKPWTPQRTPTPFSWVPLEARYVN